MSHAGPCFAFRVHQDGHSCVECGRLFETDDLDRRIRADMSAHGGRKSR